VEAPESLFDAAPEPVAEHVPAEVAEAPAWLSAPLEVLRTWMLGRVRATVAAGGDGAATLSRRWPAEVSASEPQTWTAGSIELLDAVLSPIEAAAGTQAEFPPSNPDVLVPKMPEAPAMRPTPAMWDVPEPDGIVDQGAALEVSAAFAAMDDERKALAGSWAKGGRIGGRPWAVGADALTPRLLAVYGAVLSCLRGLWDVDGAPDCDLLTRGALSLVIGEDVQPGWETGAVLGALTIEQAQRLDEMAVAFSVDGYTATEVGAAALALAG
jgi:hypothetical protein